MDEIIKTTVVLESKKWRHNIYLVKEISLTANKAPDSLSNPKYTSPKAPLPNKSDFFQSKCTSLDVDPCLLIFRGDGIGSKNSDCCKEEVLLLKLEELLLVPMRGGRPVVALEVEEMFETLEPRVML